VTVILTQGYQHLTSISRKCSQVYLFWRAPGRVLV